MEFFPFDDEYVRRLRDGDCLTEDHFVSYFTPILRMKVRSRLRRPEAIDDVVQETFFRMLNTLRGAGGREIRDGRRFGAYVARVCDNVIFEWNRGDKRTQPIDDADLVNLITRETREDELVKNQQQGYVRRVVDGMKTRDRQILSLIFFEEKSKDEVCREFDVDQSYLRVLLHRAREKFREAWEKEQKSERHDRGETDRPKPSLPN